MEKNQVLIPEASRWEISLLSLPVPFAKVHLDKRSGRGIAEGCNRGLQDLLFS